MRSWQDAYLMVSAAAASQFPRHERAEIALAGRSNVGKSSLINRLAGRKNLARTSQTPGKTRTLNFYAIDERLCLVDLPGYGFARVPKSERMRWGKLIDEYLTTREQLVGVIQVVDVRHPPSELDVLMADWLKQRGLPAVVVATKVDKIARGRWKGRADAIQRDLEMPVMLFSAVTGEGAQAVHRWIASVAGTGKKS